MTDDRTTPEESSAVAAEHALRILDRDELREAEARATSDPEYRREVARWRGRFASIHSEVEAVAPPAELWEGIVAATQGPAASNDNDANLRRKVMWWRAATAVMTAIAASLAIVVSLPRPGVAPVPRVSSAPAAPMVAMLGDEESKKAVASWDPSARQLVLAVTGDMPGDVDHSYELWVIPPGGNPRSLGTMPSTKQMHIRLADTLAELLQKGATIAISVEPKGGSPTGAPTGPVVASGALTQA